MTPPWLPAGEVARWRVLYEMLCDAQTGDVVTYEVMANRLDLDPVADRAKIQMAMRRAAKEHENVDKRALDVVSGEGYRIVPAEENLGLARLHQRKAGKSLARGHSKAVNADLSKVDAETRAALETVARAFALQMEFNARLSVNQERLRRAVESITDKQERTADEVSELRERLDRLSRLVQDPGTGDQV